jgi:hypothetical protein
VNDLEKMLSQDAERVRADFDRTQRRKLPTLHRKSLKRIRRRRSLRRATGSLVMAAAVALTLLMFAPARSAQPHLSGDNPIAAGGTVAVEPFSHYGLWPYVRRDLAEHVCRAPTVHGSDTAALTFARNVLGWQNPTVIGENHYLSHVTSTVGNLPVQTAAGPAPPVPVVKVHLERLQTNDCWWVVGVTDPDNGAEFTVRANEGGLEVHFDVVAGTEGVEILVVEERQNLRRYLHPDAGKTRAYLPGFRGPGAVIVLWKNAVGDVFSAAGVTLPAGDSSRETF